MDSKWLAIFDCEKDFGKYMYIDQDLTSNKPISNITMTS